GERRCRPHSIGNCATPLNMKCGAKAAQFTQMPDPKTREATRPRFFLRPMVHDFQELTDRLERVYSRRLALRPVSLADAWPLFQATRNPLFNKHLLWDQPEDEHAVLQRIDAIV